MASREPARALARRERRARRAGKARSFLLYGPVRRWKRAPAPEGVGGAGQIFRPTLPLDWLGTIFFVRMGGRVRHSHILLIHSNVEKRGPCATGFDGGARLSIWPRKCVVGGPEPACRSHALTTAMYNRAPGWVTRLQALRRSRRRRRTSPGAHIFRPWTCC